MTTPRLDPLFQNSRPKTVEVTASERQDSSHLVAASEAPPRSPISGQPMQLVEVGQYGRAPIKAWCNLQDRIVIPCRAD